MTVSSRPGETVSVQYTIELAAAARRRLHHPGVRARRDRIGVYDHGDPAASFHINNMGGHVGMLEMQGRWQVKQERDVPTTAVRQTAG